MYLAAIKSSNREAKPHRREAFEVQIRCTPSKVGSRSGLREVGCQKIRSQLGEKRNARAKDGALILLPEPDQVCLCRPLAVALHGPLQDRHGLVRAVNALDDRTCDHLPLRREEEENL